MSLSKFLKSAKWSGIAFWFCMAMAVINLFVMCFQRIMHDHVAAKYALLNMGFCACGMVLHYLRLKKPKA